MKMTQIPDAPTDDDTEDAATEAIAAAIALFAFVLNCKGALNRYHSWLIEQGVLTKPDEAGQPRDYRDHMEQMLAYYMGVYAKLLGVTDPEMQLLDTLDPAGCNDPGPINARMTSGVAPGPSRVIPGKGGRHRGTNTWLTGRRDGTCLHPTR